ncbi:MAG: tyrosine-type recombinase/integrase [Candidatus Acidiferrales bacterium]
MRIRRSLGTRDWEQALATALEWNRAGGPAAAPGPATIAAAVDIFRESMKARQLKSATIGKYDLLFRGLLAFVAARGLRLMSELNAETLHQFRAGWKEQNMTAVKKLDRLKAFANFAVGIGWLPSSPARRIRPPKVRVKQTMPFSDDEMTRMMAAVEKMLDEVHPAGRANLQRLRSFILFLRFTGLRIGDATACPVERLASTKLTLNTQKTGQHVHIALPDFVIRALELTPQVSERFWFWSGNGRIESASTGWQRRLLALGAKAKVARLRAHRFRDTFAVKLLLDGAPLERVSILLGHSSIRVTEKHYSPWIRARQEQAEADVRSSWRSDPFYLLQSVVDGGRPQ